MPDFVVSTGDKEDYYTQHNQDLMQMKTNTRSERKSEKAIVNVKSFFFVFVFVFFFCFLGPHLWHMEVPGLGVESELQLPAYTTATVTPDLSHNYKLHHSSWQGQILNPLSEDRDGTRILMDSSQIHFCCATKGTP